MDLHLLNGFRENPLRDDVAYPVPTQPGGSAILAVTRAGGVAARSTTTVPHAFPSATVDLLNPDTGNFYSPNRTETVYNSTSITVLANHIIQAKRMKGSSRYFIDVDDCS